MKKGKVRKLKKKVRTQPKAEPVADPQAKAPADQDGAAWKAMCEKLRNENKELRKVADRLNVLERDISQVHGKLTDIETSNRAMSSEVKGIRSSVMRLSEDVGNVSMSMIKASKRFGLKEEDIRRIKEDARARQKRRPVKQGPAVQAPKKAVEPVPVKEFDLKEAPLPERRPAPRPGPKKVEKIHIDIPEKDSKALEESAKRMDDVKTTSEGDMDTLDELITRDGKRLKFPREKRKD